MLCFPNAKINLGLNIVRRRSDGYHDLQTAFYPIPVCDALEVTAADTFSFTQTGIPVDAPAESNLVIKALRLLEERFSLPPLEVHLLKKIPFGAGLGGGSADAAFMLRLVNDFCALHLPVDELERLAGRLGADCPFFIRNRAAYATGTGNILTPLALSLKGFYLCLVKPPVAVSTREAYAEVVPHEPEIPLDERLRYPVREWRDKVTNDFEASVFPRFPEIRAIKERLYAAGAVYASMSGSGSSVFGLFEAGAPGLKEQDAFPGCFVWEGALD